MLCEGNLHSTYHLHKMLFLCYCKRVFLPESSWCRRLAAVEGLLCADFPCARNGARLWKTSPQVLHTYSRWAARRSWTCFSWRFRSQLRLNDLSHLLHWCGFSLICVFSWRFNLSGWVKTFPQISHTWRDVLVEEISSWSCKIIRCIIDGFTNLLKRYSATSIFCALCLKITSTTERSLSPAWFHHSFIYTISCFCKTTI